MSTGQFFCEHCGVQVPLEARECPACHRPFGDVRCPRCRYAGAPSRFRDGCPECGYLAKPQKPRPSLFVPVMGVLIALLAVAAGVAWWVKR